MVSHMPKLLLVRCITKAIIYQKITIRLSNFLLKQQMIKNILVLMLCDCCQHVIDMVWALLLMS